MLDVLELDFACILLAEIRDSAFKTSNTYLFPWCRLLGL